MFSQVLASGVATGSVYALFALGMVLIFRTTGVINFAQGSFGILATLAGLTLYERFHLPYPALAVIVLAIGALLGLITERVLIRPMRSARLWTVALMTLALGHVIESGSAQVWGYSTRTFPSAFAATPLRFGPVTLAADYAGIVAVAATTVLVLWALFYHTRIGLAMRGLADNRPGAQLAGVNVPAVTRGAWMAGSAMAALAALLFAPLFFLNVKTMASFVIKGLAAAVLGGLTSLPGSVAGGLILGTMEAFVAGYLNPEYQDLVAATVAFAALLIRPHGLLGQAAARRV